MKYFRNIYVLFFETVEQLRAWKVTATNLMLIIHSFEKVYTYLLDSSTVKTTHYQHFCFFFLNKSCTLKQHQQLNDFAKPFWGMQQQNVLQI